MDDEIEKIDLLEKLPMGSEKNKQFIAKYYRILSKIHKKKVNYCPTNCKPNHNLIDEILENSLFVEPYIQADPR